MSLLRHNRAFGGRDILFLILGLVGGFYFFFSYSSQEPRSAIDITTDPQSIQVDAGEVMNSLGFELNSPRSEVELNSNTPLLDSLQYHLGRSEAIKKLFDTHQVFPYFWEVNFLDSFDSEESRQQNIDDSESTVTLIFNTDGELIEFLNPGDLLPARQLNREALIYTFESDSSMQLWKSVPDSAWERVLSFNLDEGYEIESLKEDKERENEIQNEENPHRLTIHQLRRMGAYHLSNTGWNPESFRLRDVNIRTVRSVAVADLSYESRSQVLGQNPSLDLTLLAGGALLQIDSRYTGSNAGENTSYMPQVRALLLLFFGLGVLIIGYMRIRARAVDTKSALVFAILLGMIVPSTIFLEQILHYSIWNEGSFWDHFFELALVMGITGALSSIGFFALTAVGDSITRQHLPGKLFTYGYIRQGMFFNKPVGETLVRSVVLTLIFLGLWSLMLLFFPKLYFEVERTLLTQEASWAPLYVMLDNIWFSLITMLGIFLVFGSQVYAQTKNSWVTGAVTVIAIGIFSPIHQSFGPALQEFLLFILIGVLFTYVFLKWDFTTLFLTHFLFATSLAVSTGWMINGSPDLYAFVVFSLFMLFITVWGAVSIARGKDEKLLPNYVPEYVEELAQEERIKQELEIAREVQRSFLPVEMPDLKGVDIAAVCRPAFETGGDYYDVIKLSEDRFALTIGDVSGKGIQAAFYMTFTKGIIHSLCRESESPAEVLVKTNRLFCENAEKGTFISLVYGIVDLKENVFTFSRAGHNPIVKINGKTGELEELQPGGLGIGLTKDPAFERNTIEVQTPFVKDDLLILYTDGVVEALNESNEFYGARKMTRLLKKNFGESSADVLNGLMKDVTRFMGNAKQHDDMTIMVIQRNS